MAPSPFLDDLGQQIIKQITSPTEDTRVINLRAAAHFAALADVCRLPLPDGK